MEPSRIPPNVSDAPGGQQTQRPEPYSETLSMLSKTPVHPDLYSRVQYQPLSRYLSVAPAHCQETQNGDIGQTQERVNRNNKKFIHVVVYTLSGTPAKRNDFDLGDGLQKFISFSQPETDSDQIVFVRGSLSPAWIGALGTKYKIDPEFFRRHLRYLPGRDYSDLPPLPSASTETLTLVLPTLYARSNAIAPDQIIRSREKDSDIARKNQQSLSGSRACGETVIRRFSTLSDRLFSIEHEISIFMRSRKTGGRIAVVLLDNGLGMNQEGGPPCFSRQSSTGSTGLFTGISQIPVIVPRPPKVNVNVVHPDIPTTEPLEPFSSVGHVASLLPFYFTMSLNLTSGPSDILPFLSQILRLAANSECQFLNRLQCVVQDQQMDYAADDKMSLALDTLRYLKVLSEDHKQRLKQNIAFLETRCPSGQDTGGVSPTDSSTQPQTPDELCSILTDFRELSARAESLSVLCSESVSLIINGAMLRESQKAIQRAEDQSRLTVLAYLFLPLSLVASIFGMNVKQLGTGSQDIWLPFVVLIPLVLTAYLLFYLQEVQQVFVGVLNRLTTWRKPNYQTQGATIPLSTSRDNDARSA